MSICQSPLAPGCSVKTNPPNFLEYVCPRSALPLNLYTPERQVVVGSVLAICALTDVDAIQNHNTSKPAVLFTISLYAEIGGVLQRGLPAFLVSISCPHSKMAAPLFPGFGKGGRNDSQLLKVLILSRSSFGLEMCNPIRCAQHRIPSLENRPFDFAQGRLRMGQPQLIGA
jgi:hypothetical protein